MISLLRKVMTARQSVSVLLRWFVRILTSNQVVIVSPLVIVFLVVVMFIVDICRIVVEEVVYRFDTRNSRLA